MSIASCALYGAFSPVHLLLLRPPLGPPPESLTAQLCRLGLEPCLNRIPTDKEQEVFCFFFIQKVE